MLILKEVDKPGSDVELYVEKLDKVLIRKIDMMMDLRKQLLDFYKNIKTEEQMAKLFH
jgi:kinesin family protein 2/24